MQKIERLENSRMDEPGLKRIVALAAVRFFARKANPGSVPVTAQAEVAILSPW